eukprot:snap_masked-scaffold_10-processed-gene-1.43-mRNA-1 protein AED:1.00 eAED:1.00 QI:0/0/0/0/1/1/2/0/104
MRPSCSGLPRHFSYCIQLGDLQIQSLIETWIVLFSDKNTGVYCIGEFQGAQYVLYLLNVCGINMMVKLLMLPANAFVYLDYNLYLASQSKAVTGAKKGEIVGVG